MIAFGTVVSGSGTLTPSIAGVPAGAVVGVLVAQHGGADRTYTATSSLGGTFTSERAYDATLNRVAAVLYTRSAAEGAHTISVAPNTGSTAYQAVAFYATTDDGSTAPVVGSFVNASATRTHYCAASGSIDTAGAAAILSVSVFAASPGQPGIAAGDYTGVNGAGTASLQAWFQYKDAPSAVTDDRATWTYTGGTARESVGLMIAFPAPSGGGGASTWGAPGWWIGL